MTIRSVNVPSHNTFVCALGWNTRTTFVTEPTPDVMESDHSVTHLTRGDTFTDRDNDTSRFVTRNNPGTFAALLRCFVKIVQIGSTNARPPHFQENFAWSWVWVGELNEINPTISGK